MGAFDDLVPDGGGGSFDDLIPQQGTGAFDDLVPQADPAADLISQAMMAGDQPNAQVLGDPRQLGDVMGPAAPQSALDTANRLMADRNTELLGNLLYMGRELPVVGDSMAGAGTYLKDMDFGAVREADWDAVKRDWEGGDPLQVAQTVGRYIVESGGQSLADMQWMLAPQTLPAYLLTRSEESAQQRAANDGRAEPSNQDYLTGLAASGVSIALDKYGLDKIVGAMRLGDGAIQRLITAAITETITEAAQEEIEYTGEAAGTQAGYDPAQARERSLAGAIAGGGVATGLGAPAVVAQGARQGVEAIRARQQDAQLGAVLEQLAQEEAAQSLAPENAQLTTEQNIRDLWQQRIDDTMTATMPADDQTQPPAVPEPNASPLPPNEVPGQPEVAAIPEPEIEPETEAVADRDELDDEIDAALATLARAVDPDSPWEIDEESYQEMRRAIIEDGSTPDEELPAYFQLTPKEAEAFHQARYDEGEEDDVEPAEAGEPEAQGVPGDDVEPATSGPDSGAEVQAATQPEGGEPVETVRKPPMSEGLLSWQDWREKHKDNFDDVIGLDGESLAKRKNPDLKNVAKSLGLRQGGNKAELVERISAVTESVRAIEKAMDSPGWNAMGQADLKALARMVQRFEKFKPGQSNDDRRRNLENWAKRKREGAEGSIKATYVRDARQYIASGIERNKGLNEAEYKAWSEATGDEPMVRQLASSYYDFHKIDLPDFLRVVQPSTRNPVLTGGERKKIPPNPRGRQPFDMNGRGNVTGEIAWRKQSSEGYGAQMTINVLGLKPKTIGDYMVIKGGSGQPLEQEMRSLWVNYRAWVNSDEVQEAVGDNPEAVEDLQKLHDYLAQYESGRREPIKQSEPGEKVKPLQDTRIPRGGLSPQTIEVSFTNRRSLFTEAFKDAGVDPDEATLWPAEKQVKVLSKMFEEKYGIKVTATKRAKGREVIDQLLDGYRNVAFMLNVLNLPMQGISLGRTLSLGFDRFGGQYLGAYYPGQRTIVLPGRTNSFAHEWFHALDHWLTQYAWPKEGDNMWSRLVREEGQDVHPDTLEEAFVKLLNTVFYKVPESTGLDPKKMANQIRGLMTGKRTKLPPSDYKTEAGKFGDPSYWNDPAEMLARAFEAYVAHKLEYEMTAWSTDRATGEMITKGDRAYLSDADDRLRMTFPKSDERLAIFEAFDDLFDRLRERQILGDGQRAQKPADNDMIDPRAWDAYVPDRSLKTVAAQEADAFKKLGEGVGKIVRRKNAEADIEHNGTMIARGVQTIAMTMRSRMRAIVRRAPAQAKPYLQELMDAVSDDPGTGRYTGESYIREAQYRANQGINRVLNILANFDLGNMTDAQKRTMRDLLISEEGVQATPQMKKAAAALRGLMDDEWYYNTNNGIDIGYTRNGYLPRIMVYERVARGATEDGFTFVEQASKVYEVIFRNDVSEDWDLEAWKAFLRKARSVTSGFDGDTMAAIKRISQIARKIRKLENQLKNDDGDLDEDAITAQIAELGEEAQELYSEIYDVVAKAWSDEAAGDWEHRILDGADFDYDNKTPAGQYTKKRQLPPEADKLLEDFMMNDPVDAITDYLIKSSKRVAYMKRAFPMGQNGKRYDRFELLRRQARDAGADPDDVRAMQHMVNVVTGRQSSSFSRPVERLVNLTMMLGTMSLLGRAAMVSIPESINAIAATSDLRNIVKPLAYMIGDVFKTAGSQERRQLAQAIGLVTHPIYDTMIQNRLGGEHPYTARQSALLAKFFTRTGLIPLTMAQRRATVGVAYQYMRRLSQWIQEGDKEGQQKIAEAELNELGIPPEHHRDFADWMLQHDTMPDLDDLNTPAGRLFTVAVRKVSERIIIDPTTVDRPELAHNPAARIMYGIMSFTFGFYEMVTKRLGKQIMRNWNLHDGNTKARARDVFDATAVLMATAAGLFAGQLLVTIVREAMLNRDTWEEKEKDGTLVQWLLELAAYRTGFTGPIEPLIQAWRGVRYERDFTALLAGAQIGFFMQGVQNMVKATTDRNSPNTNNGEHNAARAAYQVFAQPTLMYLLSAAPAGPLTGPLYGLSMMALSSPEAGKEFADAIVGEKDSVKDRKRKEGKLKPLTSDFEGLEPL